MYYPISRSVSTVVFSGGGGGGGGGSGRDRVAMKYPRTVCTHPKDQTKIFVGMSEYIGLADLSLTPGVSKLSRFVGISNQKRVRFRGAGVDGSVEVARFSCVMGISIRRWHAVCV